MDKGYVHVYTGDGKGKTTAAFGMAVRALGARKNVYVAQFIKDMKYSETEIENKIRGIKIFQFGKGCFFDREPDEMDARMARQGLSECTHVLLDGVYDLVILDEITLAMHFGFLDPEDVWSVIERRAKGVEVIITGRDCPQYIMDRADLVTEMKEIKHYYSEGVTSRKGFDC